MLESKIAGRTYYDMKRKAEDSSLTKVQSMTLGLSTRRTPEEEEHPYHWQDMKVILTN